MKNFLFSILTFVLATAGFAAQLPVAQQETAFPNLLTNPGFEQGSAGWTASGGATKAANATAKSIGNFGYDWDSNSTGQTLQSALVAIPNGYQSTNGQAFCKIKTPSGTGTYTFSVTDGTSDLATPITIPSSSTAFQTVGLNFIFPSSGNVRIKMTSVASNEPEIYIDQCYLGDATNLNQVSQAEFMGSVTYVGASTCAWTTASTTYANFAATAACNTGTATGKLSAPGTKIPAAVIANAPAGDYLVLITYTGYKGGTGLFSAYYRASDGTTGDGDSIIYNGANDGFDIPSTIAARFSYTTPQTNLTFNMQGRVSNAAISAGVDNGANSIFSIRVYRYPTSSQQAIRLDNADTDWTTYTMSIVGLSGNPTKATTPSNDFAQWRRVGDTMEIKYEYRHSPATGSAAGTGVYGFALPTGYTIDTNKVASLTGGFNGMGSYGSASAFDGTTVYSGGILPYDSTHFSMNMGGGGTVSATFLPLTTASLRYGFFAHIPITGWTANQRAPLLIGSITSNTSALERIERARITCSSSSAIVTQSGSWLSSVGNISSGLCLVTFAAGMWSSTPSCTATPVVGAVTPTAVSAVTNSASTTTINVGCSNQTAGTTAACTTQDFQLVCMGPR